LKIAVMGSGFVRSDRLKTILAGYFPEAAFALAESPWPSTPFQNGNEVLEYSGDPEQVAELAADADLLVLDVAPVTEAVIDRARRLKAIGVCRGGPVNVNVEAATRRKIPVLNSPGRNAAATAEFTVGLILAGMRRICLGAARMKEGVWDGSLYMYRECGEELEGKTAGVVGLGNVGRRVARLLGAFGMRVLAYDPWVPSSAFRQVGAEAVDLPTLLKHSQILTLHARLTPETRGLIGKRELAQLPKGAFVANAARGGLLDYEALYEALEQGHLSGAALDVYDPEPFPESHPLLSHSRVVATPHIAGATRESALRGAERVAEDLSRLMRGEKPRNLVNPTVLA
jgi:D-3-phosphoglycerate dehydrogenase